MKLSKNYGNLLIDFYGSLLTDHQQEILEEYYKEDLSMIEIAEKLNITRSAVSDIINRSIKQLEEYEVKLKLIEQDEKLEEILKVLNKGNSKEKELADRLINIFRR